MRGSIESLPFLKNVLLVLQRRGLAVRGDSDQLKMTKKKKKKKEEEEERGGGRQ